jgi:hypothetical protein
MASVAQAPLPDLTTGTPDAVAVAHALQSPPVSSDLVLRRRELVPPDPGFYAWWARRGAIAGVPRQPHPLNADIDLFYVGISPKRASSRQNIHRRIFGQHLGGNTGSSTFRFVLASLLLDELCLAPMARGNDTVLSRDGNQRLSEWQRQNLCLTWCVRPRPWEIEDAVIALMRPPLNSAANEAHPFYLSVREARDQFRRSGQAARERLG